MPSALHSVKLIWVQVTIYNVINHSKHKIEVFGNKDYLTSKAHVRRTCMSSIAKTSKENKIYGKWFQTLKVSNFMTLFHMWGSVTNIHINHEAMPTPRATEVFFNE